ncbi:unnamed protein product [Paramecium octaurelia]|uniref:Major facilitator superfamily (MFS) profile domain-containing protein n=1 Tax=Paramecium octaurelia TaxID=43137 RepID=A0A8S1U2Y8_PAROT|nr:unnamed protein product [Paramecium octaurelia]
MNKLYPTDKIHHQYVEYPQRWIQLVLFLCALLSNIMFGFSLSPIVKEMSLVYQVDSRYLQFLTISFTVFSVIMIIPGNIINEKYGIRMSIMIGCALTFIGSIFAIFINVSFWFFFIGQLISLIGFPFRLISASKFVANWFFPENRILIMVIIALVFNASSGIAIRIPLIVLGDFQIHDHPTDEQIELGRALIESLMFLLFGLMILLCIPPILFFLSKPVTPPSYSASDECVREDYHKASVIVASNPDFILLTISFAFILGTITLFTLQMEYFISPFDYSLKDQSNLVLVGVIAGLIGDICVGTAIKKTQSYKKVLRICNILVTVLFGILILALHVNKVFFFIIYFLLCGSSAIMALTFEFSCELCFPLSENTTIAMLGFFGNLLNFLQGIPEILILKGDNQLCSTMAMIFMLILIGSSNVLTMKINENLKRSEQDIQLDDRIEKKNTEVSLLEQSKFNNSNDDY